MVPEDNSFLATEPDERVLMGRMPPGNLVETGERATLELISEATNPMNEIHLEREGNWLI